MTNPRVTDKNGEVNKSASRKLRSRPVPTDEEITAMLKKADEIPDEYFKLRVKCLIALLKKFGKRRSEIGSLKLSDLEVKEGKLFVTFTLRKKHKKGLFQYIKFLKKQDDPELLNKPFPVLQAEWKLWSETEEGYRIREEQRTKFVSLEDKYAAFVLEYLEFLRNKYPNVEYLFPSGKAVFNSYMVIPDRPLSGRQLLRLIKPLNRKIWLHLFRDLKGAEIVKEYGDNVLGIYKVRDFLDLEQEETAYRYIRRYGVQEAKVER